MGDVNGELRSAAISHGIYLERYKTGEVNAIMALLNQMDRDLVTRLERDLSEYGRTRLDSILANIRAINSETTVEIERRLTNDFTELAGYESDFQARKVKQIIPIDVTFSAIAPAQLWAAANAQVFGDDKMSRLFSGWMKYWDSSKLSRVEGAIRRGYAEGLTSPEIIRTIKGTKIRGYADGLLELDRRSIEGIVRTSTNHVATVAREKTYVENQNIVKGVQWVSTLDGRTTLICMSLDGKVDYFDGSKMELNGKRPPAHWGCRSATCPITRSWRELGIDLDEAPPGTRASMNGEVSATETYPAWLKEQLADFQRDALGAARYKMFKAGAPIESFVRDGRTLTLKELRQRRSHEK